MRIEEDIEAVELKQLRSQLSRTERTREQWIALFNEFDKDRDGRISYKELKHELKKNHDIPSEVAKKLLRKGDVNDDGYLDLDEFLYLLRENKGVREIFSHSVNRWVNAVCYIPRRAVPFSDTPDARGEYEDQYSCCPPPLCMLVISLLEKYEIVTELKRGWFKVQLIYSKIVNLSYRYLGTLMNLIDGIKDVHVTARNRGQIIAYVYDAIVRKPYQSDIQTELASLFIYDPRRRAEAWRFLTYMFVHIGVIHLLVNLLVQIFLGIPLEMVHRWWRVLIIYLSGVVAGSLGASISDPKVLLAGASGGVYAIITAHMATLIMNWKEMEFAVLQLVVFIFLAAVDIGTAVYNRYVLNMENQVSYAAHIAGATAGLLIGIYILRNLRVQSWEKILWWVAITFYVLLMVAVITWHIAVPDYFPRQIV